MKLSFQNELSLNVETSSTKQEKSDFTCAVTKVLRFYGV